MKPTKLGHILQTINQFTHQSSNLKNLIALKETYSLALKNDIEIQKFAIFDVLSNDSGKIYKEILQSIFDKWSKYVLVQF